MRNVLVLNGSPRPAGNTAALVAAFTEGAKEAGHIVNVCNIASMNINPCKGCLMGGKDISSPCVQKDDMDKIYALYHQCDTIVFASPMYFWGFTAQMKMVLDRLFAPMETIPAESDEPLYISGIPAKDTMLIMPAEDDGPANFEPINNYYDSFVSKLGWTNIGKLLAGSLHKTGDAISNPDIIKRAYDMGKYL